VSIQTRLIDYESGGMGFEGLLAWDDTASEQRPGVMVCHTIAGRTEFEEQKAHKLAELGYVGFAADVYGKETRTTDADENRAMMRALLDDRPMLQQRLLASLGTMREQTEVDASAVAAIGFCFGGLCVMDIARTGEDIAGVVSFHGLFSAPGNTVGNKISAKILALHGWDDPMAKPDQVVALAEELTATGADWQLHGYGHTLHAFTNPQANDPDHGKRYSEDADRRSWTAMQNFLAEVFA